MVAAPSVCIRSTYKGSLYATFFAGTSYASPITAGTVALCIYSGPCQGLSPMQIIHKIVHDARDFNQDHPGYGFIGDPTHPRGTRYYGYLIHPGSY